MLLFFAADMRACELGIGLRCVCLNLSGSHVFASLSFSSDFCSSGFNDRFCLDFSWESKVPPPKLPPQEIRP